MLCLYLFRWSDDTVGQSVLLNCYVYIWSGEATTLLVKACSYADSGVYKVVASNQEGEAVHEGAVEVVDEMWVGAAK